MKTVLLRILAVGIFFCGAGAPASFAQSLSPYATGAELGRETGLPIPRYVSLKFNEVRMRLGPGQEYKILWLYKRQGLPMRVTEEYQDWRRLMDPDGVEGWVHLSQISGRRTVLSMGDADAAPAPLYRRADESAPERALIGPGVVLDVIECETLWCRVTVQKHDGWMLKTMLWGVDPAERVAAD